jgi:hypothetical protein
LEGAILIDEIFVATSDGIAFTDDHRGSFKMGDDTGIILKGYSSTLARSLALAIFAFIRIQSSPLM